MVARSTDQKDLMDLMSFMELLDVVKYTGPLERSNVQCLIKTWEARAQLKGRRRSFRDNGALYVVRVA